MYQHFKNRSNLADNTSCPSAQLTNVNRRNSHFMNNLKKKRIPQVPLSQSNTTPAALWKEMDKN